MLRAIHRSPLRRSLALGLAALMLGWAYPAPAQTAGVALSDALVQQALEAAGGDADRFVAACLELALKQDPSLDPAEVERQAEALVAPTRDQMQAPAPPRPQIVPAPLAPTAHGPSAGPAAVTRTALAMAPAEARRAAARTAPVASGTPAARPEQPRGP